VQAEERNRGSRAGELKIHWAKPPAGCVCYGFCKGRGTSRLRGEIGGSDVNELGGQCFPGGASASGQDRKGLAGPSLVRNAASNMTPPTRGLRVDGDSDLKSRGINHDVS